MAACQQPCCTLLTHNLTRTCCLHHNHHDHHPTGYDPSKYRDFGDDRSMEASAAEIAREEARSRRIAKTEDEREAEAEARRAAAKEAKKRKRKGSGAFFDD
jgi:hypothetical protein